MQENPNNTVFISYGMVAVPLQILIGVGGLSVDCGFQTSITFWCN